MLAVTHPCMHWELAVCCSYQHLVSIHYPPCLVFVLSVSAGYSESLCPVNTLLPSTWRARVSSRDLKIMDINAALSFPLSRYSGWTWLQPSDAPELGPAWWIPHSPCSTAKMLIKEYRIPMPMSVEEYRIAQLYMIQVSLFCPDLGLEFEV